MARAPKKSIVTYHHGHLKDALVAAVEQRVAHTGGADFTLREIAAAAGVSHTAAYRHFESKTALLGEVARRGFVRFEAELSKAVGDDARGSSPLALDDRLSALGEAYVSFALSDPGLFRVMWHAEIKPFSAYPGLAEAANASLAILVGTFEEAHRAKLLGQTDVRTAAMTFWSALHGHTMLAIDNQLEGPFGIRDPQASIGVVVTTLVAGLGRRAR